MDQQVDMMPTKCYLNNLSNGPCEVAVSRWFRIFSPFSVIVFLFEVDSPTSGPVFLDQVVSDLPRN
jgi:hypothetical protein